MAGEINARRIDQEAIKNALKNPEPFFADMVLQPGEEYPEGYGRRDLNLSFVTNAFFRLRDADPKRHSQVITSVDFLERPLDINRIRTALRLKMAPFQRFRSIITCDGPARKSVLRTLLWPFGGTQGKFYWKEVPVDFNYHVVEETLPEPADEKALYDFMGRSFAFDMDPNLPRWKFYIFNNYKGPQGKCAFVCRISHEIADGSTLVQVKIGLYDFASSASTGGAASSPTTIASPTNASPTTMTRKSRPKLSVSKRVQLCVSRLTDPFLWLEMTGMYVTSIMKGFFELLWRDSPTKYKLKSPDQLHSERLVWFSKRVPLSVIQSIRPVIKGTVNDVLTAAVAGALRRHLQKQQDPTLRGGRTLIRALLPFNLRKETKWDLIKSPHLFGNRFTLLPLTLPVNCEHPYSLLKEAKRLCDELKEGMEAAIFVGMNKLASKILPAGVYVRFSHFALNQTTLLFTNVMGPREPIALEGNKMTDLGFFVPCPFGINVSVISYCDNVTIGVLSCPSLDNVNPKDMCECFEEEIEILKNYADAYARTPQDPPVPRRFPTVPRNLVGQLLAVLGAALLLMPKDWAMGGVPLSHALYGAMVLKLWRQSPARIAE